MPPFALFSLISSYSHTPFPASDFLDSLKHMGIPHRHILGHKCLLYMNSRAVFLFIYILLPSAYTLWKDRHRSIFNCFVYIFLRFRKEIVYAEHIQEQCVRVLIHIYPHFGRIECPGTISDLILCLCIHQQGILVQQLGINAFQFF